MNIESLSEKELRFLNTKIVDRLNFLRLQETQSKMLDFQKGQTVWFESHNGDTICGLITRINIKTITVVSDDGCKWKVSPQFLKPFTIDQNVAKTETRPSRDVTPKRTTTKLSAGPSRNQPCPCGSGQKFKRCCAD